MSRITRHAMYMAMARAASLRSTCHRLNVGAILLTRELHIIGLGYNGAPSGAQHCTAADTLYGTPSPRCLWFDPNRGCQVIHAEQNALDRVVHPLDIPGGHLYVTHSPCRACAEKLVLARVKHVYYETEYRDKEPLDYLLYHELNVQRVLPSGYIVDHRTGQVSID